MPTIYIVTLSLFCSPIVSLFYMSSVSSLILCQQPYPAPTFAQFSSPFSSQPCAWAEGTTPPTACAALQLSSCHMVQCVNIPTMWLAMSLSSLWPNKYIYSLLLSPLNQHLLLLYIFTTFLSACCCCVYTFAEFVGYILHV